MTKLVQLNPIPPAWRNKARTLGAECIPGRGWFCREPVPEELMMFVQKEVPTKPSRSTNIGPACPRCGCQTVLRESQYGFFWSCSSYPRCNGTRKFDEDDHATQEPNQTSSEKNHLAQTADDVILLAIETLKDKAIVKHWFRTPNPDLKGQIPGKLLESEDGCRRVLQALKKIS